MKQFSVFRQPLSFWILAFPVILPFLITWPDAAAAPSPADAWLAKVGGLAQQGEVDRLIEEVVYNWKPSRGDDAWQFIGQLACNLIKWEQQSHKRAKLESLLSNGKKIPGLTPDIGGLKLINTREVPGDACVLSEERDIGGGYLVRAESIVINCGVSPGIFVSGGSIKPGPKGHGGASSSYLANGAVTYAPPCIVVVCDGDFEGSAHGAVILARGEVTYWNVGNSLILCGGKVRSHHKAPNIGNSTIISADTVEVPPDAKLKNSVIKQNQPDALGPVTFFEPVHVGIEVEATKDAVRVKNLDPVKTFAKAGLQAGDVLLSLDKDAVKSVAGFRKQLRHSLAVSKHIAFEVRRGQKTINISVQNKG